MLLVALLACGPEVGEKVASTEAGEIVVAGVDWPTRYLAALQSTRGAKVSQEVMSDLRKIGGKVLVDQAADFSGIDKDTALLDLATNESLRSLISGTEEKVIVDKLKEQGVRAILLHRDIRASMDRDSKLISRLYNHDYMDQLQLTTVGENYLVYVLDPPDSFPPELAGSALKWIRESLAGRKPEPFPAIKAERGQWVLMVSMRSRGQEMATSLADGKTLDLALDEAVRDLEMNHRRYREILGFPMLAQEVDRYAFEIHRVVESAEIEDMSEESLETYWELGIDGAILQERKLQEDGTLKEVKEGALPGSAAAVRGHSTADDFLKAVARDSRFDAIRPWRDANNRLYATRTVSYREVPGVNGELPSLAPLYRGTLPVPVDFVNQTTVAESIVMAGEWYLANLQPDGTVIYKFWPEENRFSPDYNHVRHELATWNLWQAWTLDPRPEFLEGAKRAQDWTLKSLVVREPGQFEPWELEDLKRTPEKLRTEIEKEGMAYYTYGKNTKLGSVVVGLMGMIDLARATNDHQYDDLMRDQGRFVRFMQDSTGSFRGYHVPPDHPSFGARNDIVPGEAALALVMLYDYFQDPVYLEGLRPFFDHYKGWFKERADRRHPDRPWPAYTYDNDVRLELVQFGPWTVMAADAYTRVRPEEKDVAAFGLDVARWMVETYQYRKGYLPFPDYLGGYFKFEGELPAMQAFCYAEGTAAAYSMALRMAPDQAAFFEQATRDSVRFGIQMQHDAYDTYGYSRDFQVIGGIKYAMNEPKVRIDYVYHAQSSMYQWLMASRRDPNAPEVVRAPLSEVHQKMMRLMGYPSYRQGVRAPVSEVLPAEVSEKRPETEGD